jgi:integrase
MVTIGPHGSPWTPETARKEALRLLGLKASGKDPAGEKAEAKLRDADTVGRIAEHYLRHAKTRLRPSSYSEAERYLLVVWKPFHPLAVGAVGRRQIALRLAELAEAGPVAATQARAALSAMFNWAIREGYDIGTNPVLGTNRPAKAKARERVLSADELRAVWRACGDDDYGRIIRLLILTGQREAEVGAMCWSEIAGNLWTIPGVRTKNHREHVVPLTQEALALIEAQPRRNARDWIFGISARGFCTWSTSKRALDERIAAQGEAVFPWVVHDLRRTVATGLVDRLGALPHIVEAILNHASGHRGGVAGIYNRARYAGEMREALERWAQEVSRIVAGRPRASTLRRVETR